MGSTVTLSNTNKNLAFNAFNEVGLEEKHFRDTIQTGCKHAPLERIPAEDPILSFLDGRNSDLDEDGADPEDDSGN